ncbi:MAG: GNAT family N-acetyltransferase [Hyphomicrobiales bacterium]|nr:GNAT family N-acetyltransferase [Hyphomicrobiales bacterium]MBV9520698.1 GNAT family N-acetyltransferase [Hyphomicrobiales bacterium]
MSEETPSPGSGKCALPLGYSMLPRGQIATLVTYLEMLRPPAAHVSGGTAHRSADASYELCGPLAADLAAYRAIFRRVGEDWLWGSRLTMSDDQLRAIIGNPQVEVYVPHHEGEPAGLLELDFRVRGECELAFFGLVKEAIGRGLGRRLMNDAIRLAWAKPIRRFFVHTCTFDHPGAVNFYRRSSFRPYALGVEVLEDFRLTGHLPRHAAPHVPFIEP